MKKDYSIQAYLFGYGLAIIIALLSSCTKPSGKKYVNLYNTPLSEFPKMQCYHCGDSVYACGKYIQLHVENCKELNE